MLHEEDITIQIKSQGFECKTWMVNPERTESVLLFESRHATSNMKCPLCGQKVHIYRSGNIHLRDMPVWADHKLELCFVVHRYRCTNCRKCFTEDVAVWRACRKGFAEIAPSTVKKTLTGSGRAGKGDVAAALERFVGKQTYVTDDESDAVAVGIAWLIQRYDFKT